MNKMILVFYVGVGNLDAQDVGPYIERLSSLLAEKHKEYDIIAYYIPVRDAESGRVECINPVVVTPEEYRTAKDVLDTTERNFKEFIGGVGV